MVQLIIFDKFSIFLLLLLLQEKKIHFKMIFFRVHNYKTIQTFQWKIIAHSMVIILVPNGIKHHHHHHQGIILSIEKKLHTHTHTHDLG